MVYTQAQRTEGGGQGRSHKIVWVFGILRVYIDFGCNFMHFKAL